MPSSYVPPAQRINEANDEAEKLRKELEEAKAKIAALEADKAPAAEETISDGATTDDVDSVDPAPAEGTKKTSSSKKGKK